MTRFTLFRQEIHPGPGQLFDLAWRLSVDLQGVDIRFHQLIDEREHKLVALDSVQALELLGDNSHAEVAATVRGTRMVSVSMGVVDDIQGDRRQSAKCLPQAGRASILGGVASHGRTLRKGLTTTSRYTPAAR